jgi:hypothetical protein
MSFPGIDGCFGIAITAMLRHLSLVENLLETLNVAECSGNRRVVYLTSDALDVYREKLNSSKTLLVFQYATDLGDRVNRLHRFHHLLQNEATMVALKTRILVSIQLESEFGDQDSLVETLPTSRWLCNKLDRSRPLIIWCCPESFDCCETCASNRNAPQKLSCRLYSQIVAGYTSALLDMAYEIRTSVDFHHSRHQVASGLDADHIAAFFANNPTRFRPFPAAACSHFRLFSMHTLPYIWADIGLVTVIGHPGRLGNWLFRAAIAMAIAWDSGRAAVLPEAVPCMAEVVGAPPPPTCTFLGSFLSNVARVPDLDGTYSMNPPRTCC